MTIPDWSWAIPLVASCIALLGVAGTISVQLWNLNKQIRSNQSLKISDMRQSWINTLRDEMAEFQSYSSLKNTSDAEKRNWYRAGTKIELLMNPSDPEFGNLREAMYKFLKDLDEEEMNEASDDFVKSARKY